MALDATRTNPVYTPPKQAKDYGKTNATPGYTPPPTYTTTGFQGNSGMVPTITYAGGGKPNPYGAYPNNPASTPPTTPTPTTGASPVQSPTQAPYTGPGTQSGPGILESWFNQRAGGTDPGWEYGIDRGMKALGTRYGAAGLANSGAARQGEADFMANAMAQREGQLDALAGGASGEHQGRLNSMLDSFYREATGRAGVGGVYDTSAANAMSSSDTAQIMLALQKAGVDSQAAQGMLNNLFAGASTIFGSKK